MKLLLRQMNIAFLIFVMQLCTLNAEAMVYEYGQTIVSNKDEIAREIVNDLVLGRNDLALKKLKSKDYAVEDTTGRFDFYMAMLYHKGIEVEVDRDISQDYLSSSIRYGNRSAIDAWIGFYGYSSLLIDHLCYQPAREIVEKEIANLVGRERLDIEDSDSIERMALHYLSGECVSIDSLTAVKYLEKCYAMNNASAALELAAIYANRNSFSNKQRSLLILKSIITDQTFSMQEFGNANNDNSAWNILQTEANSGNISIDYWLFYKLLNRGDTKGAIKLLTDSNLATDSHSKFLIDSLASTFDPKYPDKEKLELIRRHNLLRYRDKIVQYFDVSGNEDSLVYYADKGEGFAHLLLGKRRYGRLANEGCIDCKSALLHLQAAFGDGQTEAGYYLGQMYLNGFYVDVDIEKSVQYFKSASSKGHVESTQQLLEYYIDTEDKNEIYKYYTIYLNSDDIEKYRSSAMRFELEAEIRRINDILTRYKPSEAQKTDLFRTKFFRTYARKK